MDITPFIIMGLIVGVAFMLYDLLR